MPDNFNCLVHSQLKASIVIASSYARRSVNNDKMRRKGTISLRVDCYNDSVREEIR